MNVKNHVDYNNLFNQDLRIDIINDKLTDVDIEPQGEICCIEHTYAIDFYHDIEPRSYLYESKYEYDNDVKLLTEYINA